MMTEAGNNMIAALFTALRGELGLVRLFAAAAALAVVILLALILPAAAVVIAVVIIALVIRVLAGVKLIRPEYEG